MGEAVIFGVKDGVVHFLTTTNNISDQGWLVLAGKEQLKEVTDEKTVVRLKAFVHYSNPYNPIAQEVDIYKVDNIKAGTPDKCLWMSINEFQEKCVLDGCISVATKVYRMYLTHK